MQSSSIKTPSLWLKYYEGATPQGKCPRGTQDPAAGRDLTGRLLWAMKFEKLHSSVEYNLSFKFSLNLSLWWLAAQTASPAGSPGALCGGICNTRLCRFPTWHVHFFFVTRSALVANQHPFSKHFLFAPTSIISSSQSFSPASHPCCGRVIPSLLAWSGVLCWLLSSSALQCNQFT